MASREKLRLNAVMPDYHILYSLTTRKWWAMRRTESTPATAPGSSVGFPRRESGGMRGMMQKATAIRATPCRAYLCLGEHPPTRWQRIAPWLTVLQFTIYNRSRCYQYLGGRNGPDEGILAMFLKPFPNGFNRSNEEPVRVSANAVYRASHRRGRGPGASITHTTFKGRTCDEVRITIGNFDRPGFRPGHCNQHGCGTG